MGIPGSQKGAIEDEEQASRHQGAEEARRQGKEIEKHPSDETVRAFNKALILATKGRILFKLVNGSLGLRPASMGPDDKVQVLPRGNTWFVLRRLEGSPQILSNSGFVVIGDYYLDAQENRADGCRDKDKDKEAWEGGLPEEVLATMQLGSNQEGSVLERERIWLF